MQIVNKLKMILMVVSDMPKAKAFYVDTLGLKITKDYRQDDNHWWVSLALPEGGASLNLSTYRENVTPGTISLYLVTSDVAAAHQQLSDKGRSSQRRPGRPVRAGVRREVVQSARPGWQSGLSG